MHRFRFSRFFPALGLVLVGVLAATAGLNPQSVNHAASAAPASPSSAEHASAALTHDPQIDLRSPSASHSTVSDLAATGKRLAAGLPLPPGGALTVHWKAAAEQGGDTEASMRSVLEYNAACQWYGFALRSPTPEALRVIADIASWPTFRDTNQQATAQKVSESFASGDLAFAREQERLNCHAPEGTSGPAIDPPSAGAPQVPSSPTP